MKALVYTNPKTLEYRNVPDPTPGADDALIRVERVGICGSDMHAFLGHDERRPSPLILGHEACGIITEGADAGQRVTINPLVTCGTCKACLQGRNNICPDRQIISLPPREGAFAEQLSMPRSNLVAVPDGIDPAKAALAEPIACGWHAVRLGLKTLGTTDAKALVIGGGAIGLGASLSLKAQGVTDITVVEPNDIRRAFLNDQCDQNALNALDQTNAYDIVIDGVGYAATRETACTAVVPGGVIMHIGLGQATDGLDIRRMTLQEITFTGTYAYTPQDFRDTAQAIFDGSLGALNWTETRALADGAQAFADIRNGTVAAPKIVLVPEGADQ